MVQHKVPIYPVLDPNFLVIQRVDCLRGLVSSFQSRHLLGTLSNILDMGIAHARVYTAT